MKSLSFSRSAFKDMRALPTKDAKAIAAKLASHAASEKQDVKAMAGSNFFRLRHRNWRAIFEETDGEVIVLAISHRREIYR